MIEIATVPFRFISNSAIGHDPDIVVDVAGVNMARWCRGLTLKSEVGEIASVSLDVVATRGFDIALPAAVTLTVNLLSDDGELVETMEPDGTKRYRWKRDD